MKSILTIILIIAMSQTIKAQNKTVKTSPKEVVKEFLTAYAQGNHEKFASLLHPDLIWEQPGNSKIAGVKKSKMELLQMGAKMSELSGKTLRLADVKYFDANGNTVACILRWQAAQPNGGKLDLDNVDVYTVENGQITHAVIYSADLLAEDEFWGK